MFRTTASLLAVCGLTVSAAAGTIRLDEAALAIGLDDVTGLDGLIGTGSPFAAFDNDLSLPGSAAGLTLGQVGNGVQGSIDARTILPGVIDISGTSRTENAGATFHRIAFDVELDANEAFFADAHIAGDAANAFDRTLLSSLAVFDANGASVEVPVSVVDDGAGRPSVTVAPGAGSYRIVLSAATAVDGDDEFGLRFNTVSSAPSPSAAAAGLLGLVALSARRRRSVD